MGFFDFLKPVNKVEYILNKYYRNYPRKPYISSDRNFNDWETRVSTFPNMIVQREMMIPYSDGLLPGHIRMLYWIKNINRGRIPEYFEYEHGIDFDTELKVLTSGGYVLDGVITEKGIEALTRHEDFIEKYYPKPKAKGMAALVRKSPSFTDNIEEIIKYMNQITKKQCQDLGIPTQVISFRLLDPQMTIFSDLPNTPSGKKPKYPRVLHYAQPERGEIWVFGDIWFLEDGSVGKTRQIYWKSGEGLFIDFGQTKGELVLKKVVRSIPLQDNFHEIIYKE